MEIKDIRDHLLFVWQLPQILLGLLLLAFLKKSIHSTKPAGIARIYFSTALKGAISLGPLIIMDHRCKGDGRLMIHEVGHTIQSGYLGPLYLVAVGIPSLARSLFWKGLSLEEQGYFRAYPENWADALGKKHYERTEKKKRR